MTSNTKIIVAALIGATFMFAVVCAVCVAILFWRGRNATNAARATQGMPARHFDLTSRIEVTSTPDLEFGSGPFTISFWYRTTSTNQILTFISKRASGMGDGWVIHNLPERDFYFYAAGCVSTHGVAPNSRDGQWHHVAAVRSGNELTLYFDGQRSGAGMISCDFSDNHAIRIGMDADSRKGWHFDGDMAEVHFYKRALGPEELTEEWNGGKPLTKSVSGGGLAAGYHLGEGQGASEDFSGNAHTGISIQK
jgi:hypothetical protein